VTGLNLTIGTWAAATPDKPAVTMAGTGESVSFAELEDRSRRLAQFLRAIGLGTGDHIAVLMDNQPRYFEVCWAAQRSGLYFTPVNWHLSAAEAVYIVDNCDAKVLIASASLAETAAAAITAAPQLQRRLMIGGIADGFESYEAVLDGLNAEVLADPLDDALEGSGMLYSSGTTGRPKGICRALTDGAYGNGTSVDTMIAPAYEFSDEMVYLSPAPLYHAAPLMWSMGVQRRGGTVVVLAEFDAELALQCIDRYQATLAQFVPTMFVRMLALPDEVKARYSKASLRRAVHAAAPCPIWVKHQMIEWWGPIIWEYLGATDGGFVTISPQEWLERPGSVGKPSFLPVHICDDDGNEMPAGETGEIFWEGSPPVVYYKDPEKTAAVHHPLGWLSVGDMGYLDEGGYLFLTDRSTNLIISGGVNIYPREVEDLLLSHPAVADVAVIGVPNDEFGEEVKAVIQLDEMGLAGPALAEELMAFCREHLARYKCPRSVDFDAALPRLPTGKLLKRKIRDRYWEGRDRKI
jgi:long-chain acyl-CoA synthetase